MILPASEGGRRWIVGEEMGVGVRTPAGAGTPTAEGSWRALVAEWKASGVSQSRFCRDRGLSRHRFGKWKVAIEGRSRRGGARLVRVQGWGARRAPESASPAEIRILVSGRYVVELSGEVEGESLGRVLDVLEAR